MSGAEWLVVAVGVPAGYWLVNFLFLRGRSGEVARKGKGRTTVDEPPPGHDPLGESSDGDGSAAKSRGEQK
jgi:hypothetical protein